MPQHHTQSLSYWTAFQKTFRGGKYLMLRGFVMVVQLGTKRAILVQTSQSLFGIYSDLSGLEGLIFIFLFDGLHAIVPLISTEKKISEDNHPENVGFVFRQCALSSALLLIPASAFCLCAPWIYRATQQSTSAIEYSDGYFKIALFAYYFDTLYRTLARLLMALKQQHLTLITEACEGVLDIAFTALLVQQQKYELLGYEGAYAAAALITLLLTGKLIYSHPDLKKYQSLILQIICVALEWIYLRAAKNLIIHFM